MEVNSSNFYKSILAMLLGYMMVHFIAFGIFYNGFTSSFELIANQLPSWVSFLKLNLVYQPFNSNILLFSALKSGLFLCVAYLFLHPFVWDAKQTKWSEYEYGYWIKIFCFFVALVLCWELTTYDFNYYLNSGFYLDRILLIVFTIGMLYHPLFIPVFIITALLYRSQFNFPIGGFPLFDKRVLFDLLLLSYVFFVTNKFLKIKTSVFFLFVFCIIGGNYFSTFQAKILNSPHGYEWLIENKLNWLFLNAHARGWLNFLSEESWFQFAGFLEKWSVFLQAIVLIIEGSAIVLLFKRSLTKYLLLGFAIMHLAIFLIGSMLFWKWMAIDLFLTLFLWKAPVGLLNELFSKSYKWASVLIIFFSSLLFQNYLIGWHDTPYNQLYTYQVECEDGNTYEFPKNDFNPYHQLIQHDKFNYLNPYKTLRISGFGYASKYPLAQVVRAASWEEVIQLKEKYGKVELDEMGVERYVEFMREYFKNYNERLTESQFYTSLSAPHHIYNNVVGNQYKKQSKVKLLRVFYNEYFIDENSLSLKRAVPIMEFEI